MSTNVTIETSEQTAGHCVEYSAPRVNLQRDAEGYTLEAELPGVSKEGVEVTVADGKLTLIGRGTKASEPAVYSERKDREYRRVFELDPGIDPDTVTANIEQGLLKIRLLKAEAVKPRKIAVA